MHSLTYNGTAFNVYGLIVRLPTLSPTLIRTYDSIQVQDRAWAGKGQAGPGVFSLQVVIVGTSAANCLSRVSTIRGLLDQEEECALSFDMYTDRYWMAKFDSLDGMFTADTVWEGTLIFTCHDGKAYATLPITVTQTLDFESADYGTITAICQDDYYVYVVGTTSNKVYKLNRVGLEYVAVGPDYTGAIKCICCDADPAGYIYYGGDGGAGQYDICKLKKSDMATIVRGPDYGGIIYGVAVDSTGTYVYYGGNGGAGQYDVCKLTTADMTTIARGPDYAGIIYAVAIDWSDTFIFYGGDGGAGQHDIAKLTIADMTTIARGPDYTADIRAIKITTDDAYIVYCGDLDTVAKLQIADMATIVSSADLGGDLKAIAVDFYYIYAAGVDNVVYKLLVTGTAGHVAIGKSDDYGGDINALDVDEGTGWLYIGGATTKKVWKLDTRSTVETVLGAYTDSVLSLKVDDTYIYMAVGDIVLKLRKSDLVLVAQSASYGGDINALAIDDDYVYIGGVTTNKVYQLSKDTLQKIAEGPDYAGTIYCIYTDSATNYIYYGGNGGAGQYDICKLLKSNMSTIVRGPDYGGIIYACATSSGSAYIYYGGNGGAGQYDTCKLKISDMTTIIRSADKTDIVRAIAVDANYVFVGSDGALTVEQLAVADLSKTADSVAITDVGAIALDDDFVYVVSTAWTNVLVLVKTDLTVKGVSETDSPDYSASIDVDDGYVYHGGVLFLQKLDKRILWTRSDHELTVTTVGTARTNPVITIVADGANYWAQIIENTTTSQEFTWEGTVANADVLEIDSTMWSVELNAVSVLSGQSGDFIQLAAGANALYFENIVGTVQVDYTDRFA